MTHLIVIFIYSGIYCILNILYFVKINEVKLVNFGLLKGDLKGSNLTHEYARLGKKLCNRARAYW